MSPRRTPANQVIVAVGEKLRCELTVAGALAARARADGCERIAMDIVTMRQRLRDLADDLDAVLRGKAA